MAAFFIVAAAAIGYASPPSAGGGQLVIPRTWDDAEVKTFELPLASAAHSPQHVSSDYYYRLPVRRIYRSYPVYHPSREPKGYLASLRAREPEIVFDEAPDERSDAEWQAHGEFVFDAPISYNGPIVSWDDVRSDGWYRDLNVPLTPDGVMPYARYVVREKGRVEVGNLACAMCHTRVMPDGLVLKGAQGNFPFDPSSARGLTSAPPGIVRSLALELTYAPWDRVEGDRLERTSDADLLREFAAVPNGVLIRQGTSMRFPTKIPDLIGIKDRKYLDATGFVRHRGPGDIMRYAAANQSIDMLASYGGWRPAGVNYDALPEPGRGGFVGTQDRHSDAQLFALAQYLYRLTPPPNPNAFDARAAQGQRLFTRAGCGSCHTPPLYTNNKLLPVRGFTPPADQLAELDIMSMTIDTDPTLALKTRRGTGYYKVPSLKGVWYRGPFEHNGSVATLEEWFDPARIRNDYRGAAGRPVRGHEFTLRFTAAEREAVIAFLNTL